MADALRATVVGLALLAIAVCDDSPTSRAEGESAGTGYPDDRVITNSVRADPEVDRDPTPQTGTGGPVSGADRPGAAEQ